MPTATAQHSPFDRDALSRVALAGVLTGVTDGLFSSVLSVAFYHSTVQRLFQGVASTLLGAEAFNGGATMLRDLIYGGLQLRVRDGSGTVRGASAT